jgi:8-oxo-dGTP pyrophosphatase MutT (NUDIX family)
MTNNPTPEMFESASPHVSAKAQVHIFRREPGSGRLLFLVLKRPERLKGFWQPVTGNIIPGEDFDQGARREVAEETGICRLLSCTAVHRFEFCKGERVFRETVYVAEAHGDQVEISGEHEEFRWLPYDAARDLIHFDSNKDGLDRAYEHVAAAP